MKAVVFDNELKLVNNYENLPQKERHLSGYHLREFVIPTMK